MFSRSPKSFNDVSSASKSGAGRSGLLPRESPKATGFGATSISDKKASSTNGSELYDQRSSALVTFGEFNGLCSSVVQKKFRKEKYAKLVSVPSLYRKCCEQILPSLSARCQRLSSDRRSMTAKLETFIDREYKM